MAHSYLRDARSCYLRWGALGKVKQLDERYPVIEDRTSVRSTTTIGTSVEQLDMSTAIKASHAVSGEVMLEKLIETLLVVAVEHAGAERGLLILPRGEALRIAAEARTGRDKVEVHLGQGLVTPAELPESLLRYVVRTQDSVILDDALTQNRFSEDGYLRQRRSRLAMLELLDERRRDFRIEKRYRREDDQVIWADLSSTLVPATGSAPAFFATVVVDITERKRAEEELRRSEAYLTQGERIAHMGSWGWHVGTGLVYWSKEHFRIFDYVPETAKPSYSLLMERIHPEDRFSFEEILNRAVRDKGSSDVSG